MDRKLRPCVLHDLLCNLEMVAIPSSASLSPSPVSSYIACVRQTEVPSPPSGDCQCCSMGYLSHLATSVHVKISAVCSKAWTFAVCHFKQAKRGRF